MFGLFKKREPRRPPRDPPVPKWKPEIVQPIDQIIDRVTCYTDRKRDFAVFAHGTRLAPNDYLIPHKTGFPLYIKTETGDDKADRTIILEHTSAS